MSDVRDGILSDLRPLENQQSHRYIQHLAETNGLTVTRIDPLRSTTSDAETGATGDQKFSLESKDVRVEFNGPYSGVVTYFAQLRDGPHQADVESFRMVPTSKTAVRVSMQIKLHELSQVPELIEKSFAGDPAQHMRNAAKAKAGGEE